MPEQEQRHFSRIPFTAKVSLANAEGHWDSQLLDISLKGALIKKPIDWQGEVDEKHLMSLHLEDSAINIRMETIVAHVEMGHIGLKCLHIDLDSITHLRRLMELNLGDPELLERELSALSQ